MRVGPKTGAKARKGLDQPLGQAGDQIRRQSPSLGGVLSFHRSGGTSLSLIFPASLIFRATLILPRSPT